MDQNPYELFQNECPEVAARFGDIIEAEGIKRSGPRSKQLINIVPHPDCESKSRRRADACNDGKERRRNS